MDRPFFLGGVVVAVAVLVTGGAFLVAPRMQSAEAKVSLRSGEHVERARRLLQQFSRNQDRIGALLEALALNGVGAEVQVDELLQEESSRTAVEEEDERLQGLIREHAGTQNELEERLLKAAYGGSWQEHQRPRPIRLATNVTQMTRALTEGLKERRRLLAENDALLERAREAVNQALAESVGEVSGSGDANANRLKGIVLYYLGQAGTDEADRLRQEAAQFRIQLAELGRRARSLLQEKEIVVSSGVDRHIATAQQDVQEAEALLAELQASATAMQADVEELESRIAETRAAADHARAGMERMETRGVDFTDPHGFEKFSDGFNQFAESYRRAISELHRLKFGTLRNARIDTSGDFVEGQYVPIIGDQAIQIDRGLRGLQVDLADLQLQVTGAEEAVESARVLLEALVARRAEYREISEIAVAKLEGVAEATSNAFTEFKLLSDKAGEAEDASIGHYGQSVRAFQTAARLAATRVGDAGAAVASLSPEARQRAPKGTVAEDDWLEQQYKLDAAAVQIELGRLHYTVSEEAGRIAQVLTALPAEITPAQADPTLWEARSQEARTQGIEVLHAAYDALQRTRGKLRGHWTVAAEAAAAASLLALMGEEDLQEVAIAAYEQVVSGNEDQPIMQPYVDRLRVLRGQ